MLLCPSLASPTSSCWSEVDVLILSCTRRASARSKCFSLCILYILVRYWSSGGRRWWARRRRHATLSLVLFSLVSRTICTRSRLLCDLAKGTYAQTGHPKGLHRLPAPMLQSTLRALEPVTAVCARAHDSTSLTSGASQHRRFLPPAPLTTAKGGARRHDERRPPERYWRGAPGATRIPRGMCSVDCYVHGERFS